MAKLLENLHSKVINNCLQNAVMLGKLHFYHSHLTKLCPTLQRSSNLGNIKFGLLESPKPQAVQGLLNTHAKMQWEEIQKKRVYQVIRGGCAIFLVPRMFLRVSTVTDITQNTKKMLTQTQAQSLCHHSQWEMGGKQVWCKSSCSTVQMPASWDGCRWREQRV